MKKNTYLKTTGFLILIILVFSMTFGLQGQAASAKIKLNKSSATLYLNGTKSLKLKATVKGKSKSVKWTSSNKRVAAVNASGKVTAKKTGRATITAKCGKATAKCKVTVKTANTKTKNKKALAAYKNILQKEVFSGVYGDGLADVFYLLDIDGDGVKEMILRKDKVIYIYTYSRNKAVQILARGGWGGNSLTYYKKSKVLLYYQSGSGVLENTYYGVKNGKIAELASIGHNYTTEMSFYELNGKAVSKEAVERYCQKLSKENPVELNYSLFKENTAINRERYCK